jgi:hypothetical protein
MIACKRGGVKDSVSLSVPCSPSSIEAYNRLDDRAIEVRSATGAENFYSSPFVQSDSMSNTISNWYHCHLRGA